MNTPPLDIMTKKEAEIVLSLGEVLLGYEQDELGSEFIAEADAFLGGLEPFLQSDLKLLLRIINMRSINFLFTGKFKKFTSQSSKSRKKLFEKFVYSRISLLRTGGSALRALCGWSLYSIEKTWAELDYPGITIGREDETPTLLYGKEKWTEGIEL